MRFRLSILTLFRSPMKTLVTFILLFATSFAFVSRGAEYATTVAEINKAEAQYSAVGTLQAHYDHYYDSMESAIGIEYIGYYTEYVDNTSRAVIPLTEEIVELVESSPYVASSEVRMVASGTAPVLKSVLEQPLVTAESSASWWLHNGTFEMDTFAVEAIYNDGSADPSQAGLHVETVIAGVDEICAVGQRFHINEAGVIQNGYTSLSPDVNRPVFEQLENGHRYFVLATTLSSLNEINKQVVYDVDYPIVDLTRLETEYGISDYRTALKNPEMYGLIKYQHPYGDEPISALEYVDALTHNFHSTEVVFTAGMETLNKYHSNDIYITDGRVLSENDTGYICVVSSDYANENGLAVGDSIELELKADTFLYEGKVFARIPLPYTSSFVSDETITERGLSSVTNAYEIVGIWSDSDYDLVDPFTYSVNTVFVPASTYPWAGEVEPTMLPSTFSFTLNHPGDMAKIEAELGDQLAALGYELSINDMGYAEAKPSFEFMKLSALIGFIAMSAALLLSLILTVYLYIIRKKHDYAIMRALGTTRSRSNRSLLVGLFALAIPAVFLGSLLALALTQGFAADLSAQISEITGNATASSMPAWLVGAFGAGVLALLLIFARAGLARVGRTPPLALLQGR